MLSLKVVVTIAANTARNTIYSKTTLEQTGTLLTMLALLLGEHTIYLDQGRLDINNLVKFDLLGNTPLQTDYIELYKGFRQQRSDIIRLDVLLFDKDL